MGKHTRRDGCPREGRAGTLGELIHEAVRRAVELAVASSPAARSGCGASMGGATSRRCSVSDGEVRHDASRIGARIAFDGPNPI
jgi:hypothetical protein